MNKIDGALKGLAPSGNLITRTFEFLSGVLSSVGREILNVAEFALGHILGDAIEFVVQKMGELISATIQAGAEFQTMSLRLNRLNLNDIAEAALDYVDAGEAAAKATQEQLKWIQMLAVQTPYDAQDIANVYTLARSYGVADEQARGLTEDITDFAAGMGLGSTEIKRIIVNFGQMIQQGKVTQREMNDLARGAFVPVNDVLERMQENVGLTGDAFDKFRLTGEGVQEFFKAFSQIVEERFQGAAQDMARTFQGATANAADFVKSLLGMNVVMPVLDKIGGAIADFITVLTQPEKWEILTLAAQGLGGEIVKLMDSLMGLGHLNTEAVFWGIVKAIDGITNWIQAHRMDIVNFFKGIGTTIQTQVVPFIIRIVDAFNTIRNWVTQNSGMISDFFSTLGEIVGTVISDLTGGTISMGGGLQGVLDGVKNFMGFVIENKNAIIPFVENFLKLFAAVQVVGFVFGVLFNIVVLIISPILALGGILVGVIGVFTILGPIIASVATFFVTALLPAILIAIAIFVSIIAVVVLTIGIFQLLQAIISAIVPILIAKITELRDQAVEKFTELRDQAVAKFTELRDQVFAILSTFLAKVKQTVDEIIDAFLSPPWRDIGIAIMEGVKQGILSALGRLIASIQRAAQEMYDAAMNVIGASSPSKLFMNVGIAAMEGMAKGIEKMSGMVAGTMESAVARMTLPAMALPAITANVAASAMPMVTNTTQNSYNYNLTVNSGAPIEPILQDYNMMQSLAQG